MTTMVEFPHEKKIVIVGEAVEKIDGAKLMEYVTSDESKRAT